MKTNLHTAPAPGRPWVPSSARAAILLSAVLAFAPSAWAGIVKTENLTDPSHPIYTWTVDNNETGTDTWTVPAGVTSVQVVVVGGGGGGSMDGDPGGGAGGLLYYGPETPANGHREGTGFAVTPGQVLTVQVGGGGRGLTLADYFAWSTETGHSLVDHPELHGVDSIFGSLTATGGGAGRRGDSVTPATASGGSGGGDRADPPAGTAVSDQGFVGGNNSGGGGGAGGAGNPSGRNGGVGLQYSISGTASWYAGGGGGGSWGGMGNWGAGGSGVGGNGGNGGGATGGHGVDGTGSGGGGGGGRGGDGSGGRGGSGVVIISYTVASATPPTHLVYTFVPGTGVAGIPFSVTVEARDAGGAAALVTSDTTVSLGVASGTGSLGGATSDIIANGTSSVTISGVTYSAADTMTLTATPTSGMTGLTPVTSGDIVFALQPTKLVYTSVPATTGFVGTPFSVTVQAQDALGNPQPVIGNTTITLSVGSGAGSLGGGTTIGTILNNTNSITIPGVIYDTADTMTLTATASGGTTTLAPVTSDPLVFTTPTKLVYSSVPTSGMAGVPFSVTVEAQDALGMPAPVTSDTEVTLSVGSGAGSLTGGTTAGTIPKGSNGVTMANVVYDKADTMTLTATATTGMTGLTPVTSDPIVFSSAIMKSVTGTAENPIITWTSGNQKTVSDTWTVPAGVTSVKVLVVGGGGGGSMDGDPGGGAGGLIYYGDETPAAGTSHAVTPGQVLTVQVGGGGRGLTLADYFAWSNDSNPAQAELQGADSQFGSLTATGGGAGRRDDRVNPATASGGSGGGDRADPPAGTAVSGQGFVGGNNSGGGGGAGGPGNPSGRNGGVGLQYSISGTAAWYAGGGGGGQQGSGGANWGAGGSGVGGDGGHNNGGDKTGHNGVDGTGSGGGGGGGRGGDGSGGHGGSGIVIVTYSTVPSTTYEAWASTHGIPGEPAGGDSDGDGMTNFQEYAFGLDPTKGSSVSPIKVLLDKAAGTFSYTRTAGTALAYTVWTSTDLQTWDGPVAATQPPGTPDGNGVETVDVQLTGYTPPSGGTLFVRVKAE
ncbi:MAG: hypothetical protein NTW21_41930 [Verrucomicrobia bacterium]|nr:hypothetical protein [Verrucomicrobiota bacterium]